MFALLFYSLLVVTQIRGHIAGSFSPSSLRFVPYLFLSREEIGPFFPSRLASNYDDGDVWDYAVGMIVMMTMLLQMMMWCLPFGGDDDVFFASHPFLWVDAADD